MERSVTRLMEILTLLALLITCSLCVSSSPLTTDSALYRCHTEDPTCTNHSRVLYAREGDPLTSFRIVDPKDGDVDAMPIEVRILINARSMKEYEAYYADARFCVELNGLWKKCKTPGGPPTVFRLLPEGNYTAEAYITDKTGKTRYHETEVVTFTVVGSREYNLRNGELAEKSRTEQQFPEIIDLLHWAELEKKVESIDVKGNDLVLPRSQVTITSSPMLVIGVKTAVVTGFPRRHAIRDTWANPATLPRDVRVIFLGCEPNMTVFENDRDRRRVLRAVAKERAIYRDLLTEELECTDSYRGLSDKVKSFMHLSAAEFPGAKFMMLVDDDVYLKTDQLSENLLKANRPNLYFGEVWSVKFANRQEPIRDPESPYHLPTDQYPMPHLLPYASGPHYVVAMDNVRFISKNYWRLSSMNGLEDVSSGFWLRTMQVHAQHTRDFSSVRSSMACEDNLVSFADLSPLGIRSIHANVLRNRIFCHGFHSVTWHRHLNSIPELEEMLQRPTQAANESPSLQFETLTDALDLDRVTVIVSTPSHAGMKWQFLSSVESVETFTQKLVTQARHLFPDPTPTLTTTLLHELQRILRLPPPFATSEPHFLG